MRIAIGLMLLGAMTVATEAKADPCKAIPDRGPMPSYLHRDAHFAGPVVYVGDGDSLCVAVGQGPENWVEIRLEDFYAPVHSPPVPMPRPRWKGSPWAETRSASPTTSPTTVLSPPAGSAGAPSGICCERSEAPKVVTDTPGAGLACGERLPLRPSHGLGRPLLRGDSPQRPL
jgi:hypothetical protein